MPDTGYLDWEKNFFSLMFKTLGIIESFGTGIGEAKRALEENGSPALYYKVFDITDNVTSVVIPVNEEYMGIKNKTNPRKINGIESETQEIKQIIRDSHYSSSTKHKLIQIFEQLGAEVFGNSKIVEVLGLLRNYCHHIYQKDVR